MGATVANNTPAKDTAKFRTLRPSAAWFLAATVLLLLGAEFAHSTYGRQDDTYVHAYNVWGVFHYYLGAKYFPELGYFSLYSCALAADAESAGVWHEIDTARDMRSYRLVPRASLAPCPRANFTDARWSEFSRDVEYFAVRAKPIYFANVFIDKGFNPPPSWVAVARPLAEALPLSSTVASLRGADVVFNLDVLAVLLGVSIIWASCGGVVALLTAGLAVLYFGSFGHIGGQFFQYLWFPLLVASAAAWSAQTKQRPALSGALLGAAAGLQTFPLLFGLPIIVRGGLDLLRKRPAEEWRPNVRFVGALTFVLAVSFALGCFAGRGATGWRDWQEKITIHKDYLRGEIFNIGLANLTADAVSANHDEAGSYAEDVPNSFSRLDALRGKIPLYYALCAVFLALWLASVACAPATGLFGQGFLILYAMLSLSPFYYLSLVLVPFMFWKSGRALRLYASCGTIALFAAHALLFPGFHALDFVYWPHLLSACAIALFLLSLAAVALVAYRPSAVTESRE